MNARTLFVSTPQMSFQNISIVSYRTPCREIFNIILQKNANVKFLQLRVKFFTEILTHLLTNIFQKVMPILTDFHGSLFKKTKNKKT